MSSTVVYEPGRLFDAILDHFSMRSDAQLARKLEISPAFLSKMRHGVIPVGASTLIRLHEATGFSTRTLRALMGDHRPKFSVSHIGVKKPARGGHVQSEM